MGSIGNISDLKNKWVALIKSRNETLIKHFAFFKNNLFDFHLD